MILFVNFAPIEFLGGAERKIIELYQQVSKKEKAVILSVDQRIANVYGKLVLNRTFDKRQNLKDKNLLYISGKSFVPFTKEWRRIRHLMKKSDQLYVKAEILELFMLFYFSGTSVFRKTTAGIRSPWVYESPKSFFDHLHNFVYKSTPIKLVMSNMKGVHVLNHRDKDFFKRKFKITNVFLIPNDIEASNLEIKDQKDVKHLEIVFIGELITRKGVDTLIKIIKKSPRNYRFYIIGDGPLKKDITALGQIRENCKYLGYLRKEDINLLLSRSDVLLLPSRAEGFAGVILEAMSHGMMVINSKAIHLRLPRFIELSSETDNDESYIDNLYRVFALKQQNNIDRQKISKYCMENYAKEKIAPQLLHRAFGIHV